MDYMTLPTDASVQLDNITVPGCLLGQDQALVSTNLTYNEGKISAPCADATVVDMKGAMVFPAFVDMHTHLDKGHIWPRTPNPTGSFEGAINAVGTDKPGRWDDVDLPPRMTFSLKCAYAHGTRAIRTHLDQFSPEEDVSWTIFSALRDEWAGRIDLQAACLSNIDMVEDPENFTKVADLVARHDGVLGGLTTPSDRLPSQLETFFAAAQDRGMAVDFHVDETLDPSVNTLKDIAQCVLDHGFDMPVVVGHLCSLSTMTEDDAMATLDLVAKAGLNVVSLPMCNLYLQDRHWARTPRNRGITLVHEMKSRGISVSFASDNTRDPFYAYGDMDMLEVMRETTRIGHLDHSDPDWTNAFLTNPAAACGFAAPSLEPGAPADLVICRAREWTELFARPQADRIVLRAGKQIDRTLPDYSELDHLMRTA
ncbi:cytosine deaminase [Flavimaricola marinus]|uniref:Cytosine deaminase n=1 Tax=Flavimaricola marinus TaxID=1819565 RepID=A0A238LEP6_9RHOB|nr:cytosine deaminase [Flavimaricola marinus]SMY08088.1 Cytosine deaminase [Flavimaricola marinus]